MNDTYYNRLDNNIKEMTIEEKSYLDKYLKQNELMDEKFYKWFNEEFEKRKDKEENGYDNWLKSDEDIENDTVKMSEMNEYFEKKKKAIVVKQEIKEYSTGNYTSLSGKEEYGSDMFSSLYYSDLKQAHSIIPVSSEFKKTMSMDEYKNARKLEDIQNKPLNEEQSSILLNKKIKMEEEESVTRAYYFAKKTQEAEQANQLFMAKMKMLK
jgi:hypothetical protein